MSKHLTDRDIDRVVSLLDGWNKRLTWEALSDACVGLIGTSPARQTLFRTVRIRHAYSLAKVRIKKGLPELRIPQSLRVAAERIARLEAENTRLKRESSALLEQFVVWQYNAYVKGISENELNRALPGVDRNVTEQ